MTEPDDRTGPERPDRPRKPGGPRGRDGVGGRGAADRAGAGKPRREGDKPAWRKEGERPSAMATSRAWRKDGDAKRDGDKPAWRKDGDKPPRRDAPGGTPWRFTDGRDRVPRGDEDARPRHDDPPIPDDVHAEPARQGRARRAAAP